MELSDKDFSYLMKNECLPDELHDAKPMKNVPHYEQEGRSGPKGVLEDYYNHCKQQYEEYTS